LGWGARVARGGGGGGGWEGAGLGAGGGQDGAMGSEAGGTGMARSNIKSGCRGHIALVKQKALRRVSAAPRRACKSVMPSRAFAVESSRYEAIYMWIASTPQRLPRRPRTAIPLV